MQKFTFLIMNRFDRVSPSLVLDSVVCIRSRYHEQVVYDIRS
jgi:hypothetical protein